jgi:hypothetical protein
VSESCARDLGPQIGQQPGARGARRAVEEIREAATRAEGGVTKGAACLSYLCRERATQLNVRIKELGTKPSSIRFNYERLNAITKRGVNISLAQTVAKSCDFAPGSERWRS